MANETVIEVEQVSKKFCKDLTHALKYGFIDLAKNALGFKIHSEKLRAHEFWALNDLSFKLKKGEILGIIGANGSGKSTILKLLNGILIPDKGSIKVKGSVGALIEVGAGFHPMLTGRENIYINGAILGMSKRETEAKFKDIVKFADIGEFLDVPVKNYSSGMYARLGFSVAVHSQPDILLVDEILSVGDFEFQQKAFNKIQEYLRNGTSIVLVSHNLHTIRFMTHRVLVINKGKLVFSGNPNQAVQYYQQLTPMANQINFAFEKGSNQVLIKSVKIRDLDGRTRSAYHSKDGLLIEADYFAKKEIKNPVFSFAIVRDDGLNCFGGTTAIKNIKIKSINNKGTIKIKVPKIYLTSGVYSVLIVILDSSYSIPYGAEMMGNFKVVSDYPRTGKTCPAFILDYDITI